MPCPRLRYSLRTFLVGIALVALSASWLGYQLHIKSQRQAMLTWIIEQGGEYQTVADFRLLASNGMSIYDASKVPGWTREKLADVSQVRAWLGDTPIFYISLAQPTVTTEDRERVAALFPEAGVEINVPDQKSQQFRKNIMQRVRSITKKSEE